MACDVLFRDDWICAICKPPGMFVHPSGLDRNVRDCRTELERSLGQRVFNVHRIDRPASGIVVYALNRECAADLSLQFRNRTVQKRYLAIVRGHVRQDLVCDEPIPGSRGGRALPAITSVVPLSTSVIPEPVGKFGEGWFSLVMAEISTGRPHQVRRHLRRMGNPIIGDTEHGDPAQNRFVAGRTGFRRLGLLAYSLECTHPTLKTGMSFCSGLPDWWREYLNCLELDVPSTLEIARFARSSGEKATFPD